MDQKEWPLERWLVEKQDCSSCIKSTMDKITKAGALATWMKLNCTRLQDFFTFWVFGINLRSVIFLRNFHNTSDFTRDEANEKSDLKTVLIMKKDLFLRYLIRYFLRKFLLDGRFLRRIF